MKKLFLIVSLAAIMILSGCTSSPPKASVTPEASRNPVPNSELAKSLITRVQNNVDMNSFEGFMYDTSYGDCLEKIAPDKFSYASIIANTELLGYPASVDCAFKEGKGDRLILYRMEFTLYPRTQESGQEIETDVVAKLDAELGNHSETDTGPSSTWEKDGLQISFHPYEERPYQVLGIDGPQIILYWDIKDRLPETPGLFPYKMGTDIYTMYGSLKPGKMPDEAFDSAVLDYLDDGINVNMGFNTDETGVIRFSHGDYSIGLNGMELNESIRFFELLAGDLQGAIGIPDHRGYYISNVHKDRNGKVTSWGWDISIKDDKSAQDILDSGSEYYGLHIHWPDVQFEASYGVDVNTYIRMEYYGNSELSNK